MRAVRSKQRQAHSRPAQKVHPARWCACDYKSSELSIVLSVLSWI